MLKLNKSDIKGILISCAISVGTGGLSGFLSMISNNTFDVIQKPPLTPPTFVFPIVWLILYLLMGLSAYLIYKTDSPMRLSVFLSDTPGKRPPCLHERTFAG